jgi:hypothetical protein
MSLPTTSEVACRVFYITQSKDFSLRCIKYATARRPIDYERRCDHDLTVPKSKSLALIWLQNQYPKRTGLYQRASMSRRWRNNAHDAETRELIDELFRNRSGHAIYQDRGCRQPRSEYRAQSHIQLGSRVHAQSHHPKEQHGQQQHFRSEKSNDKLYLHMRKLRLEI